MVDRDCRRIFAEQVRHFAAGVLTVDEYAARTEELTIASYDPGVSAVWRDIWCRYDDFRTTSLRGAWQLSVRGRREVALCLLFLYSGAEYAWPDDRPSALEEIALSAAANLVRGCTFGLVRDPFRRHYERQWREREGRLRAVGDLECWPFLRRSELDSALRSPGLLAGSAQ
jgi:hypothetical protein